MQSLNEEKFLNDVFLTLKKYVSQNDLPTPVIKSSTPEEMNRLVPSINAQGIDQETFLKELEFILERSVRTNHPLFLNQLFGGADPLAIIGDWVTSLLNPTMATFEIAPVLTVIEKRLVSKLLQMTGLSQGEGIMVTGGSNANLLGMLCARTDYNPSIRQNGFTHNNFRIYVSSEAHYSFDKAANITGLGTQNLILIPSNEKGEMIPEELERIIAADIKEGLTPLMIGATLGTTVLGAFDPLSEIAKIAEKYKIWLHVDAAWGGAVLFTKNYTHMAQGLEYADSITFDAHKTLGAPLITSFFLTKRAGILRATTRGGGGEYLFHDEERVDWDTGTYSLQCGRRADCLKLWFLWRIHGTEGLIERTEALLDLARYAKEEVQKRECFKLYHANFLNVCFQTVPKNGESINEYTQEIRKRLVNKGLAMVNYAERPDGTIFFRLVLPNHHTKREHIDYLLDLIENETKS